MGAGPSSSTQSTAATSSRCGSRRTGARSDNRTTTTRSWSSAGRCIPTRMRSTHGSRTRRPSSGAHSTTVCHSSASVSGRSSSRAPQAPGSDLPRWTRSAGTRSSSRRQGVADPVIGAAFPARFDAFQWHYYTWELPLGAELLAANGAARQAYRLGERTWAVQFHPEVNAVMLDYWFTFGESDLPVPKADSRGRDRDPAPDLDGERQRARGGVSHRKRRRSLDTDSAPPAGGHSTPRRRPAAVAAGPSTGSTRSRALRRS